MAQQGTASLSTGLQGTLPGLLGVQAREPVLPWAAEVLQGLNNSLGQVNNGQPLSLQEKVKLLVQSPAALEDALACLLGNADSLLRVWPLVCMRRGQIRAAAEPAGAGQAAAAGVPWGKPSAVRASPG